MKWQLISLALPLLLLLSADWPTTSEVTTVPTRSQEIVELMDFFRDTRGSHWLRSRSWGTGDPCAQNWFGILCDEFGRITSIYLEENNLTGIIPRNFGSSLKSLRVLYLTGNNISGELPVHVADNDNLEWNLALNNFQGTIPSYYGERNWNILNLCCNNLTGTLPNNIGPNTRSSTLAFHQNRLSGTIPKSLGRGTLMQLYLNGNMFTGDLPKEIAQVRGLQHFAAFENNLTGTLPEEGFKSAAVLQLNGTLGWCCPLPDYCYKPIWTIDCGKCIECS